MTLKKHLKEFGFNTFKHADEKFNELKEQFIEMAQLKSDFDIEKFTVKKEGNFIAHNFHMLMRQYSLALSELKRMLIEKEEIERKIKECKAMLKNGESKLLVYEGNGKKEKYADLYIKQLINQLDLLEINIVNKAMMVRGFEACRVKLIELNGNKEITNEQYQKEQPEYWKWFLQKRAVEQNKQAKTGISEGVWMNIGYLEEPALLNDNYQVKMLDDNGFLNLITAEKDIAKRKVLGYENGKPLKLLENDED